MKNDIVVKRNVPNMNRTYHTIVAGFPGVGKSTAAELYPDKYIDMESSYYHWIYDENNGTKECAPNWPNNYVDAIIHAATTTAYPTVQKRIICISTHKEVLAELAARGIAFDAVCPRTKEIYIQRYIDRGNNEAFVKLLQNKFEDFVADLKDSDAHSIYFTDGYFSDIFNKDYLIHHFMNGSYTPKHSTNKMIVAVWPVGMASEIDVYNGLGFGYINPEMAQFGTAETLIHHVRMEIIRHSMRDFDMDLVENNPILVESPASDISKALRDQNWEQHLDVYYGYAKELASTNLYPKTKFIAIDAYHGIMDRLRTDNTNFILIVPSTYEKFSEFYNHDAFGYMGKTEFESARRTLMSLSFHTIMTDKFVPLCLDDIVSEYNSIELKRCSSNNDE